LPGGHFEHANDLGVEDGFLGDGAATVFIQGDIGFLFQTAGGDQHCGEREEGG
jgi:hypothetical protein